MMNSALLTKMAGNGSPGRHNPAAYADVGFRDDQDELRAPRGIAWAMSLSLVIYLCGLTLWLV